MIIAASRLDTALQAPRRARRLANVRRLGFGVVELEDVAVRYRVAGGGAVTVVLAADPPNVIEHHDHLIGLLAPRVRVVCFDLPAFGFSLPDRRFDFAPAHFAETVARFLERLGLAPYVLAFPCTAGLIALRLAATHPRLVSRLVIVQCASWAEQARWVRRVDRAAGGIIGAPVLGQLALAAGKRRNARAWYRAALPAGADSTPFVEPALAAFRRGACFCLASSFQAFARAEAPAATAVAQPALVLWGLADRTHHRTDRRALAPWLPDARWVEFERAGHFPDLEEPERFRDLLLSFCLPL